MDALKGMASKLSGGSSSSHSSGNVDPNREDYVDKALDFVEKKTGHAQSRQTNENLTDKAREFYEKQTGKHVSDKVSN
ncbi:hypothetical protein NA57DRAFT_75696 [Rhizodiscina lignyota]|uniref:Uncharacterized protein n=1 Tax=Rhizodiscina lignyota TaxID=1504668 RepID=A0A9P4IAT7_9PEZI|nr:hypothetical protein NA57DRAFT_75696 [Rhizodiscina lignyota]